MRKQSQWGRGTWGRQASVGAAVALGSAVGLALSACAVKERDFPEARTELEALEGADAGGVEARAPRAPGGPSAGPAPEERESEGREPAIGRPAQGEAAPAEEAGQLGAACSGSAECATAGGCVDGVCCASLCAAVCGDCNVPGSEGVCTAVESDPACGEPPCPGEDSECRRFDRSDRGLSCAGVGVCLAERDCPEILEPAGTPCAEGEGQCNGSGACVVPEKASLGEACGVDSDCAEGHCVPGESGAGLCCNSACEQDCQGCNDQGQCVGQTGQACTAGERPGSCQAGLCRALTRSNGGACGEDADCTSGVCSPEGTCCEARCGGVCEACNRAGQCVPVDHDDRCDPVDCDLRAPECQAGDRLTESLCLGRGRCKGPSDCRPGNFRALPARAACGLQSGNQLCDGAGNCTDPTVSCNGALRTLRSGQVCCRRVTNGVGVETLSSVAACRTALESPTNFVTPIECDEQSDCKEGLTCCIVGAQNTQTITCRSRCVSSPASSAGTVCSSPGAPASPAGCRCPRAGFPGWGFCGR